MEKARKYASIGVFRMDPAQRELQHRALEGRIAPMVGRMRGLVVGAWCDDPETARSHHWMVFEDEAGVRALHEQIRADAAEAERHGVFLESLTMMPVITVVRGGTAE